MYLSYALFNDAITYLHRNIGHILPDGLPILNSRSVILRTRLYSEVLCPMVRL